MANENLTTYAKTPDPLQHVTVTSAKADVVDMPKNLDEYISDDKGVDHFDADYEHLFECYTNSSSQDSCRVDIYVLTNTLDDSYYFDNNNTDSHFVISKKAAGVYYLSLGERYTTNRQTDSLAVSANTLYYPKLKRVEGGTSYLYLYIYTDSGRTTQISGSPITLTLNEDEDFRYNIVVQSRNSGQAYKFTGYIQNIDLQEAVAAGRSFGFIMG